MLSIWGVEVPVAYVLSKRIGLEGVWYGYPAAFIAGLAFHGMSMTGGLHAQARFQATINVSNSNAWHVFILAINDYIIHIDCIISKVEIAPFLLE